MQGFANKLSKIFLLRLFIIILENRYYEMKNVVIIFILYFNLKIARDRKNNGARGARIGFLELGNKNKTNNYILL